MSGVAKFSVNNSDFGTLFYFDRYRSSDSSHKLTVGDAEHIIQNVCREYPGLVYCVGERPVGLSSVLSSGQKEVIGLVLDDNGSGVGIVTPTGDIKALPVPIPPPLPQIAENIPKVKPLEPTATGRSAMGNLLQDLSTAVANVQLKQVGARRGETPVKMATQSDVSKLMSELKDAVQNKKLSTSKRQECDVGYYWSNVLKKCIAITKSNVSAETDIRNKLVDEIKKRAKFIE